MMVRAISICLFVLLAGNVLGQQIFLVDDENPCPNQWVTFSLPSISGCTEPRIFDENQITITPTPDFTPQYTISHVNNVHGIVAIAVKYSGVHGTISVSANYQCNGVTSGTVSKVITMKSPLGSNPTVGGLDAFIYSGDASSATASVSGAPSGTTYSWSLSVVSTTAGSINSSAIASPSSNATIINWPSNFVGDVDITATATSCGSSTSTTRRINVKYLPSWTWDANSPPAINCSGSTVAYHLQIFNGFTLVSTTPHLSGTG